MWHPTLPVSVGLPIGGAIVSGVAFGDTAPFRA
jgi:hypothetical protein